MATQSRALDGDVVGLPLGGLLSSPLVGPVDGLMAALAGGLLTGSVVGAVQMDGLQRRRARRRPSSCGPDQHFTVFGSSGAVAVTAVTVGMRRVLQDTRCGRFRGTVFVGGGWDTEHMFDDLSVRAVESELVELAGHLAAATCRFLQLLAEFDERDGWAGPGLRSCAHWLNWRVGLSVRTAREHLRVAHALRVLPATSAAFAAGRVSYAKVRALTRIATPATEQGLLTIALHGTASHVESVVAAARAGMDPRPAAARRGMRWSRAGDGSLVVSLRIPTAEGAQLVAAVEALLAEDDNPDGAVEGDKGDGRDGSAEPHSGEQPPGEVADPIAARRLDALLELVTGGQQARQATLVVHLRADLHAADPDAADSDAADTPDACGDDADVAEVVRPVAWIEGGPAVHPAVAERLTCTAAVQALLVDRQGNPLYLGRARRTVSPGQVRALRVRDRDRCVFPGCTSMRHLQAHHLRWWRYGGQTDLDNLALVCGFHHSLVHEQGYALVAAREGGFTAACPDGTPIPGAGAPTHGDPEAVRVAGIDDRTITPRWGGERLDRDHVLAWLLPTLRATSPAAA